MAKTQIKHDKPAAAAVAPVVATATVAATSTAAAMETAADPVAGVAAEAAEAAGAADAAAQAADPVVTEPHGPADAAMAAMAAAPVAMVSDHVLPPHTWFYDVLSPLEHDLVRYEIGDQVELTAAQAVPLLGHTVKPKTA